MEKARPTTYEETKTDNNREHEPRIPDLRILSLAKVGPPYKCSCGNTKFELTISEDAIIAHCATINCARAFMVISNKVQEG